MGSPSRARAARRSADVLAIDLPWSLRRGRTAIASRSPDGIAVERVVDDDALVERVTALAGKRALVVVDVTLDGCEQLSAAKPCRDVDRRFAQIGIAILPSVKSGLRGPELRARLHARRPDLRVREVYPYAVLRTLWALHAGGRAFAFGRLVDVSPHWRVLPPRYKRERELVKRRRAVREVAAVLAAIPGFAPRAIRGATHRQLDGLCDELDALLALVAGIAAVDRSPWSWLATISHSPGAILTIADVALRSRFVQ
jgi:predicted nuclease with RNAse H fold